MQPDFFVAEQKAKESERIKQIERERAFEKNPDAQREVRKPKIPEAAEADNESDKEDEDRKPM